MNSQTRNQVVEAIARHILSLNLRHPIRVGIDGITASGKSTFARELAQILKESGRTVVTATLDGFHHPRARRYEKGRESPEGYYFDAYNYPAIIEHLLLPLGPVGSLKFKTQVFDHLKDQPVESEATSISRDAILVVDGSFSLRNELRPHWDVSIYLKVAFEIAEQRASERDAADFGSSEHARRVTRNRYHGAHRLHNQIASPAEHAQFVVCNDDPSNMSLIKVRGITAEPERVRSEE
jgi:uridine kinase